ncbi:helix-turn-helix domain-containing protein [Citrobacter freundii]|nr:helix-turn-helix domain-containing protein [Citrobacter freundii]
MSKKTNQTFRSGGIVRFGERLKEAIGGESNLSFAKKCGLSETVIRNYLAGKSYPGIDKLPAIAEAAGTSIEWLVTGEESQAQAQSFNRQDLELWWSMILTSLSESELSMIINAYQENGKKALLTPLESKSALPEGVSQSSFNTAVMLEKLSPEKRKEILALYGLTEQASPVAPEKEPQSKAG